MIEKYITMWKVWFIFAVDTSDEKEKTLLN
jgi:hypothetical protein